MSTQSLPLIATERLQLRALKLADAPAIFTLHSDVEVQRYLSREIMQSPRESRLFIDKINTGILQRRWFYWGIARKDQPEEVIGTICLWQFSEDQQTAELGYELLPTFQRKGIMREALAAVEAWAQTETKLTTLRALVRTDNQASVKLLTSRGFTFLRALDEEEKFSREQALEIRLYQKAIYSDY